MSTTPPPAAPGAGDAAQPGHGAGIAMMLAGVLLFAVNDTLGKWLVGGFTVGQLVLVRSIAGLMVMAPFIRRTGPVAFLSAPRPGLQLLRVFFSTLETSLFFWALVELPLAEVMTYYMAGPIYVTALSPWLLREPVGWRRWTAVVVGFCGVVLALHPSVESISLGSLCALAGSFSYACFMLATRKLAAVPGTVLMTAQLVAALLFGAVLVLAQGWTPPGALDLVLMLFLGVGSLGGNLCVNRALHLAPASAVVPYQYTMILWGVIFGYAFFGDLPDVLTLAGAALIIAAGMFIFLREQQLRGRRPKTERP
ncbi:DMT family transporter [Roseomonas haemaphysalidis]|uniref:DMT family transporter n=1 Tax=Roseomonas haemaphysalidis TaxID=2768162 RepID=A0ABS3KS50_9PROT|nr:DMT family transporter [Roseomonas haemaphysalidis]MBO1079428.1 DMT family transporter [Roseomonas haemaphysalidis]